MASFEFLAVIVSILGLTASITYYAMVLRNSNKARQAQVYVQIWTQFTSPDFLTRWFENQNREWDNFEDYMKKFGDIRRTDAKRYADYVSVGVYFEGIGSLLKNGFIDAVQVTDLLGSMIVGFWEKMKPVVLEIRERTDDPRAYLYVEYLYDRVKPIVEQEYKELKNKS